MATTFTDQTFTYEGIVATKWYTELVLAGTTMQRLVAAGTVYPDVKHKVQIPSVSVGGSFALAGCDFEPVGSITMKTRAIEVVALSIDKKICERDLEPLFLSAMMAPGSNNEDFIPAELLDMILIAQTKLTNKDVEIVMWRGDTAGATGTFLDVLDGYLVHFLADGTVVDLVGVVTTAANIQAQIALIYAAIPAAMQSMMSEPTIGIWLSPGNASLYKQSLVNAFNNPNAVPTELVYIDCKLFETTGLTNADMVFADARNLWAAVDVLDEEKEISLIPQKKISGARTAHLTGNFKLGVNHGVGAEIVWWHKP